MQPKARMIIDIHKPETFSEAMQWVKTYRTIYSRFVITLNGVVLVVLHYQKD